MLWSLDSEPAMRAALGLTRQGRWEVAGHRIGVHHGYSLLWAEGHPGPGLACPDELPAAMQAVEAALAEHGLKVGRRRGVSRLDATATVDLGDTRGAVHALLSGVAALDPPRLKINAWRDPALRQLETVYLAGSRGRIYGRVYNKRREQGETGEHARFEDQRRFGSDRRLPVEGLTSEYVKERLFRSRFAPLWRASKGVKVATVPVLARELATRALSGEMTSREVERAAGYLLLASGGGLDAYSRATMFRRRRELRDRGLVVADGFVEPVEVNLGEVLDGVMASEHWGHG